jgi:hypothetical protein
MTVNVATSREPLLHLAARLLVAAETDLENAGTLRSTAATLQLLTSENSSPVIDAPTPAAVGVHGPEGEGHEYSL